ncbi:hypothetical protein CSKR_109394 [Clonorchis sinensis]|nr:hypothetical protein CSKR_109394 [Clonorchis sinensis]
MKSETIVLLVILLQKTFRALSGCPSTYTQIAPDLCLVKVGITSSFFVACEMCATYGAERGHLAFLLGRNAKQVITLLPGAESVWFGLNAFLTGLNGSNIEWRDVDPRTPGFVTVPCELTWTESQPDGNEPILFRKPWESGMHDGPVENSRDNLTVYCEFGGSLPTGAWHQQYRSDFPVPLDSFIQTDQNLFGCYREVNASSIIDCARKCSFDVACRSLYYDENNQRCVHTMYVDALLPSTFTSSQVGWKRFAKTSHPHMIEEL